METESRNITLIKHNYNNNDNTKQNKQQSKKVNKQKSTSSYQFISVYVLNSENCDYRRTVTH